MLRFRINPALHMVLLIVSLVIVLGAALPHFSELSYVISGDKETVNPTNGCPYGYTADGPTCQAAGWVRAAEYAGLFFLLNGAGLAWAVFKTRRAHRRGAATQRASWQARLTIAPPTFDGRTDDASSSPPR